MSLRAGMEGYVLQFRFYLPSENRGQQREWLLLTCVDCIAFIDVWVGMDSWVSGDNNLIEEHAVAIVTYAAGRRTQQSKAQKQPQWQQQGPEDYHGLDLFGNYWAWNWVRATTHLFICSGAGTSGWGHTCKSPAHSSLRWTGFWNLAQDITRNESPCICHHDPLRIPVLLMKGNVLIVVLFCLSFTSASDIWRKLWGGVNTGKVKFRVE